MIDEANQECLAVEVGSSIPSIRLTRVLNRLLNCYGAPEAIPLDNGPEMIRRLPQIEQRSDLVIPDLFISDFFRPPRQGDYIADIGTSHRPPRWLSGSPTLRAGITDRYCPGVARFFRGKKIATDTASPIG